MKNFAVILLAGFTAAAPSYLVTRQNLPGTAQNSANDLDVGSCREAYLIVARGSTEPGNLVGPKHIPIMSKSF